jgi:hypothetical protein
MAHQQQRPVQKRHIVSCGLVAVAFTAMGGVSFLETLALHRSTSVAVARVVESRTMRNRRGGFSYEVRYAFAPSPGAPEIGRSDFFGRTNLWSSLPEADWQAATATNRLAVRFDARNPCNNAPDVAITRGRGDSGTLLGLGIGLALLALYGEVVRRRQLYAAY